MTFEMSCEPSSALSRRRARHRALLLALLFVPLRLAPAQERPEGPASPPQEAAAGGGEASAPSSTSIQEERPLGPELFPLYQHYLQGADQTEVRNILYLYTSRSRPDGSRSRLLLPFFLSSHDVATSSSWLYLFPLLYFHKRSPEESFDYWLPLFYRSKEGEEEWNAFYPLYHASSTPGSAQLWILPPFFRSRSAAETPEGPESATRLGLPGLVELLETRSTPRTRSATALNFFNWKGETRGGLPLFETSSRLAASATDSSGTELHSHLLPLYWRTKTPTYSNLWIFPLYGQVDGPRGKDIVLLPLLSRLGAGSGGSRVDLLTVGPPFFSLFHYARSATGSSLGMLPLFFSAEDSESSVLAVLGGIYFTSRVADTGKRTHSFLFPLSHFDWEPDGSKGTSWFFPYIETFNRERLWRLVLPLYYEYQDLGSQPGGDAETSWFFRTGFPLYWSWGTPRDNFTMGLPLYWSSAQGARGWRTFLPLYYEGYNATSHGTHLFPLFSYRSFPSRRQLLLGGPLFVHERFYDGAREPRGWGVHLPWPILGLESRDDGHLFRLLPLFSTYREGDTSSLLLTPFYYQQSRPEGTSRYFFPFYGRFDTPQASHRLYAAATYIRTEEKDDAGQLTRERDDVLWGLASFEREPQSGSSHQHVLPLAFWRTSTPAWGQTIVGPLYYSQRSRREDEERSLSLFLGNVFLSQTVDAVGPSTPTERISSDRGFLWPLTRWYESREGTNSQWIFPFYVHTQNAFTNQTSYFPFYYERTETIPDSGSLARHFFLYTREAWKGGSRWSLAQVLVDWQSEQQGNARRLRLAYPLVEYSWSDTVKMLRLTPLCQLSWTKSGSSHWLFPIYWQGRTTRDESARLGGGQADGPVDGGGVVVDREHFFLVPLYGFERRSSRTDHYVLFPFFHLQDARDSLSFELWPSLTYRSEPSLHALRLWPLHAHETRASAGDLWISRYLYLSKYFGRAEDWEYRLDPFLLRFAASPKSADAYALFRLFSYHREGDEWSMWIPPLSFGAGKAGKGSLFVLPLYYERRFGQDPIDYNVPWRFLLPVHYLSSESGESHLGLFWRLYSSTSDARRQGVYETSFLYGLFLRRKTEHSSTLHINPFFTAYEDSEDDVVERSFLFSLYRVRRERGVSQHTLFYFIKF